MSRWFRPHGLLAAALIELLSNLAGKAGIEPATVRLTAGRSTAELHAKKIAEDCSLHAALFRCPPYRLACYW